MIIHITGPSGAGKTTLGNKLRKNKKLLIIETDDIDDKNALEIFKQKKYDKLFTEKGPGKFDKLKDKLNRDDVKLLIQKAKEQKRTPVFIGLTINPPGVTHGYSIKIDFDTLYRQTCVRNYKDVCTSSLKTTFKEKNIHKMYQMFTYIHKIRTPFPPLPPDVDNNIEWHLKFAKRKKYRLATSNQILSAINTLV